LKCYITMERYECAYPVAVPAGYPHFPHETVLILSPFLQDIHTFLTKPCLSCRESCRISTLFSRNRAYPVQIPAGYPHFSHETVLILLRILQDIHTFLTKPCLSCCRSCRISTLSSRNRAYPVANPAGYPHFSHETVLILSPFLQDIHTFLTKPCLSCPNSCRISTLFSLNRAYPVAVPAGYPHFPH